MQAGTVAVQCPCCHETVDVPVSCEIVNGELAHEGHASLECKPDMTDLWAHVWTHDTDI